MSSCASMSAVNRPLSAFILPDSALEDSVPPDSVFSAEDAAAVLPAFCPVFPAAGCFGCSPVFFCMAAAYRSSSVAARAPSPTAVTTWRSGLMHTSPTAYSPSLLVFRFWSVTIYPCPSHSAIPRTSSVAGSYPANTKTPKLSPSPGRYSVTSPVSVFR